MANTSASTDWKVSLNHFGLEMGARSRIPIPGGAVSGNTIILGYYDHDTKYEKEDDVLAHHSQFFSNGSICDLTGQRRKAEVVVRATLTWLDFCFAQPRVSVHLRSQCCNGRHREHQGAIHLRVRAHGQHEAPLQHCAPEADYSQGPQADRLLTASLVATVRAISKKRKE